jgi:SAM-dependent methyltransferase
MESKDWDKIAKDYFRDISSPFEDGVSNPLESEIEKIEDKKKKTVLDAGCGIGNLIPILSQNFEKVTAFDFSEKMVDEAKKNCAELKNVEIFRKDMTELSDLKEKFDIIFAVNSIIMPSIRDVDKSIKEIFNSLKENGKFIGIFPALESVLYEAMVVQERQLEKHEDEKQAAIITKRRVGMQYYDFYTGIIDIDGKQKHFYEFEIIYRLKKAGFKNIKIKKVLYPWEKVQDTQLPETLTKADLWDWFVVAEK